MTEENEHQPPSYKQLLARVAVLTRMLNAHLQGQGKFDPSGMLTRAVLDNVPEEAEELVRQNQMMEWTLERVKQGFYNLIHAEALPSEGWDAAVKELVDSIDNTLQGLWAPEPEETAKAKPPDSAESATDSAESTESTQADEPAETPELSEPADPVESSDATDLAQSTDSEEPTDSQAGE
ncbi:hypothetical protein ACFL34_02150 [Candidatus Sumerlaeota bacterium]